jgi:hypothetical protein
MHDINACRQALHCRYAYMHTALEVKNDLDINQNGVSISGLAWYQAHAFLGLKLPFLGYIYRDTLMEMYSFTTFVMQNRGNIMFFWWGDPATFNAQFLVYDKGARKKITAHKPEKSNVKSRKGFMKLINVAVETLRIHVKESFVTAYTLAYCFLQCGRCLGNRDCCHKTARIYTALMLLILARGFQADKGREV